MSDFHANSRRIVPMRVIVCGVHRTGTVSKWQPPPSLKAETIAFQYSIYI